MSSSAGGKHAVEARFSPRPHRIAQMAPGRAGQKLAEKPDIPLDSAES